MYKILGDVENATRHEKQMAKIKQSLSTLWIKERGHPASFREESGHRRLAPDAWLYNIFVPIEAGILTPLESAQALYYSEWALQRDTQSCGNMTHKECGERVWTTNWVPSIWYVSMN